MDKIGASSTWRWYGVMIMLGDENWTDFKNEICKLVGGHSGAGILLIRRSGSTFWAAV